MFERQVVGNLIWTINGRLKQVENFRHPLIVLDKYTHNLSGQNSQLPATLKGSGL